MEILIIFVVDLCLFSLSHTAYVFVFCLCSSFISCKDIKNIRFYNSNQKLALLEPSEKTVKVEKMKVEKVEFNSPTSSVSHQIKTELIPFPHIVIFIFISLLIFIKSCHVILLFISYSFHIYIHVILFSFCFLYLQFHFFYIHFILLISFSFLY